MLTKIVSLERVGVHSLRLYFNDGSSGVHDFAPMVQESGAMLNPLRNPAYFSRVFLECGALTWPNGFDIAPEWLRRQMIEADEFTAQHKRAPAEQSPPQANL